MVRCTVLLFSLLLIFDLQPTSKADNPMSKPYKFLNRAIELHSTFQLVKSGIETAFGVPGESDIIIENQNKNRKLFVERFDKLSDQLYIAKTQILEYLRIHFQSNIAKMINDVFSIVWDINYSYNAFVDNIRNKTIVLDEYLLDFANKCLQLDGLPLTIAKMHKAFRNQQDEYVNRESITSMIAEGKQIAAETVCSSGMSAQQFIWYLYNVIALADSKAVSAKLLALDIVERSDLKKIKNNPVKQRRKQLRYDQYREQEKIKYLERTNATLASIKEHLAIASRELWRCDPASHQEGTTYAKFGQVFQGYFVRSESIKSNDIKKVSSMTWGQLFGSRWTEVNNDRLKRDCSVYKNEEVSISGSDAEAYTNHCLGNVSNCKNVDEDLEFCISPDRADPIYYWARVRNTDIYYGEKKTCDARSFRENERMCYCTCQSWHPAKVRYFNLNMATSDINENKVVTGVQIKEIGNDFYIQIQQGRLAENGTIIGNLSWKQVEETKNNDERYQVTFQQNTVYLDDLDEVGDKIVTGLRFQKVGDSLRLEVRTTPFDYVTGKLDISAPEVWKHNSNNTDQRSKIDLKDRLDPSKSTIQSEILSRNNQFINFGITEKKSDVGQNTIPYIDIQPVEIESPTPLSGVGLYHKSNEKSGGFLGLKIFNYDYSQHIA